MSVLMITWRTSLHCTRLTSGQVVERSETGNLPLHKGTLEGTRIWSIRRLRNVAPGDADRPSQNS